MKRPTAGTIETRAVPDAAPTVEGKRLRGLIPYGIESRDLGGWSEVIEPGALRAARLDDLVATVDHVGVPIGRYDRTLDLEDRDDGLHWSVDLPESRSDVREAVERGDLQAGSWRMVVKRDEWRGNVRHVHEIAELRDVAVVTTPAYTAAATEFRAAPEPDPAPEPPKEEPVKPTVPVLRVEDRADPRGTPEARILDAMRAVPQGESRDLTHATAEPVEPDDLRTVLIDKLRETAAIFATGVNVVPTDKRAVHWPVLTGDLTAAFYDELEEITPSDVTLDEFSVPVKAIKALVRGSSEAFEDSDPSLMQIVTDNLNLTLALKGDRDLTIGNDPKGFKGLTQITGTQSIAVGGPLSWDHILKAAALLGESKIPGPYAVLMGPRPALTLALTKEETGSNAYLNVPAGVPPIYNSFWLPVTGTPPKSTAVVFAPSQVTVVVRRDITVEVDRSQEFSKDAVLVRGKYRLGMDVLHPESIVKLTGIDAPAITA
jgi:HK97 family phage major capsid protein/HK97 family phage prohead protease